MIKSIVKDTFFLQIPCSIASLEDEGILQDLKDTLLAHKESCVGLAANMIGYSKCMIIISPGIVMINPVIVKASGEYNTVEGCLSLPGTRQTKRYKKITVQYEDEHFHKKTGVYTGSVAHIIQHETDHLHGILI